ncbi:sialin [Tribolium castaneum]|uniref:Inorganic phosphate cotransporter-like Protein n=1 Tax=Tribolium castaneum TaxID=7070 RepID=D6WLN8_TRICA|nr:PREDICTED: sialin [Tribolium castaneum]EFA04143.1 Putative inorganic phosphate cotransporter-like Protein [Tribolium castaneum]|eukprot:XP_972017.1 PREDICTED: sialin [Tribolium castaneum]
MAKNSEILTCQRVLSIMVIIGFMIHHMIRINISIAIVEMVARNDSNNSLESHGPRYNWDEQAKNDILGYFFWGYLITQVPGGRLSEMFGTKIVVGIGLLTSGVLTVLTPVACNLGYYWLLAARFSLGVAIGIHWPSTPPLATRWIAPADTSKFMSHMTASSLGAAITLPVCGYLIADFGWPSVFYVTGAITIAWSIAWFWLVYDSPEQHPRISREEKERLKSEIKCVIVEKTETPWRKILTSAPVWALIVTNTGAAFAFFVAFTQLPTYMSQVLHFNIKQNGWFSSLPYLVRYLTSVTSSIAADAVKKTGKFSTTAIRKLFTGIVFGGMALLFFVQAFWGYNYVVSIVVFTGCLGLIGLSTPGVLANFVDIAPPFSGTIFGVSQIPVSISGYVTTKIVALITKEEQGFEQWAIMFWILVGSNLFAFVFFMVFASGEEQQWSKRVNKTEMEKLQSEETLKL